jgi:hypothetical protein
MIAAGPPQSYYKKSIIDLEKEKLCGGETSPGHCGELTPLRPLFNGDQCPPKLRRIAVDGWRGRLHGPPTFIGEIFPVQTKWNWWACIPTFGKSPKLSHQWVNYVK